MLHRLYEYIEGNVKEMFKRWGLHMTEDNQWKNFKNCTKTLRNLIIKKRYRNDHIFSEGEPINENIVYFVLKGEVTLSSRGKDIIDVKSFEPLGELELFGQRCLYAIYSLDLKDKTVRYLVDAKVKTDSAIILQIEIYRENQYNLLKSYVFLNYLLISLLSKQRRIDLALPIRFILPEEKFKLLDIFKMLTG